MLKKISFLFFTALFAVGSAFAQVTISGRVICQTDREPLPYAAVTVNKPSDNSLVTGVITDDAGRFNITVAATGDYDVHINFMGYESAKRSISASSTENVFNFGDVFLTMQAVGLGEVTVTARRQAVSAALDKKTFEAADFVATSGGSTLDMLKTLPGVTVNRDGKVELRGSDRVAVLIDGKQSALTGFGNQRGLSNIPVSQIESIEIINNPSARYDAAGMAGIINIKFKKENKKGFNGDAGFTYGLGMLTKRKEDLPTGMPSFWKNPKYTPTLNINYRTEKLNIFLQTYLLKQHGLPNNEFTTRIYDDGVVRESQVAENRENYHYNIKFGFDWYLSPKHTVTVFGLRDYNQLVDTTRVWYFTNRNYISPTRKWAFYEDEIEAFTNVTAQHRFKFDEYGHELNTQFQFTKVLEDVKYKLYQNGPEPEYPVITTDRTHLHVPEYVYNLNTDYTKPLSFGRLEAGAQGRLRHTPITYTVHNDPDNTGINYTFGDRSEWNETLVGIYGNMIAEFDRIDVEAGLRGEYTDVSYSFSPNPYFENAGYDYFDLFPNVRLTLKLNQSNKISLFYNRRIDRPGEEMLRIYPQYRDPELLKIGNPSLRPQYTQNVELAHKLSWSNGSIFTALYFKNIQSPFSRIYLQDLDDANITVMASDNVKRATNTGIELGFEQRILKSWDISGSFNVYQNTLFAHEGTYYFPALQKYTIKKAKDVPMFFKVSNRIRLPWNVQMELSGLYFSDKNIAQGKELSRGSVDLGLKKMLMNNKLEVTLTVSDMFNTMGVRQDIRSDAFKVEFCNFNETQIVTIGARYKF